MAAWEASQHGSKAGMRAAHIQRAEGAPEGRSLGPSSKTRPVSAVRGSLPSPTRLVPVSDLELDTILDLGLALGQLSSCSHLLLPRGHTVPRLSLHMVEIGTLLLLLPPPWNFTLPPTPCSCSAFLMSGLEEERQCSIGNLIRDSSPRQHSLASGVTQC